MTETFVLVVWAVIVVVLALIGWAFVLSIRPRRDQESLDIIPERFQPAPTAGSGRDGGAILRSETDVWHAHLVATLKNSGSRPLSVDQIVVFDRYRLHKYAVFQKADLRLNRGDTRTVQVQIPPFEGIRYVDPPEAVGMIEVVTETRTFRSEPFRFSDLL